MAGKVGVLALQGCIEPHYKHLKKLGAQPIPVRTADELSSIDRVILPGGESTTMLNLMTREEGMLEALREFSSSNPTWGICAGAILLAKEVMNPEQPSLSLLPVRAERNAYGSQLDSFKSGVSIDSIDGDEIQVDFIRAPRLKALESSVQVLACYKEDQVLLRKEHLLTSAFHTELGDDSRLHEYFLNM